VGPAEALGGHGFQASHRIRTLGSDPQPCAGCIPPKIPPVAAASCAGGLPVQLVGASARRGKDGMRPMLLSRLLSQLLSRLPRRRPRAPDIDSATSTTLDVGKSSTRVRDLYPRYGKSIPVGRPGTVFITWPILRRDAPSSPVLLSSPVLPRSPHGPLHHEVTMKK